MFPLGSGGEDIGYLVFYAQIHIVGAGGGNAEVSGTIGKGDLGIQRHGCGSGFRPFAAAKIHVPFAVLTEFELLSRGDAHLVGHFPVAFGFHGEVVVPVGSA